LINDFSYDLSIIDSEQTAGGVIWTQLCVLCKLNSVEITFVLEYKEAINKLKEGSSNLVSSKLQTDIKLGNSVVTTLVSSEMQILNLF